MGHDVESMDSVDDEAVDLGNKHTQFETANVSEEKKQADNKTQTSKRKKTIKKEPEIEIDSDGTFKPKLKKSETVKRQIEEAKLEEVKLKHHEFENIPQTPPDEALTNVIM